MTISKYFGLALGLFTAVAGSLASLDRNLVYRSPMHDHPQFEHDTSAVENRHRLFAKRQLQKPGKFVDEHYPTFYGGDFSNAPLIWGGGINFTHSVASGDSFDTSVLLWTRAEPVSKDPSNPPDSVPVCVEYKISEADDLSNPVDSGSAFTSYDVDFTVKVEAKGLKADSKYFYQFSDCANEKKVSPKGKTRTLPHPDTAADEVNNGKPLTFAVFSCAMYQNGWFNAYGVARHNISTDIMIHLGDYIYEYSHRGGDIGRAVGGNELATLKDYRERLALYRTDPYLVEAHLNTPWIAVWDDHEVANNAWKAGTGDSNDTEAGCKYSPSGVCFSDRKMSAVRAYHEWMPIRQVQADDKLRIWRGFKVGKLLDLIMLDTRQYNRDITDLHWNTVVKGISTFENRSAMGFNQEQWFFNSLSQSKQRGSTWRFVGQQVVFTQLILGAGHLRLDAWDGYTANRARILDHIRDSKIDNVVLLSGDSHANWVSDLAYPNDTKNYNPNSGNGALGVEFAGTAVSSTSFFRSDIKPKAADAKSRPIVQKSVDLQWSEASYRGFFTVTVDSTHVNATYYATTDLTSSNLDGFATAEFSVRAGGNKLSRPVAGGSVKAGVLKSDLNKKGSTSGSSLDEAQSSSPT